ncbi:MAG TPA: hypothetical protein VLW50_11170 [Streptosporangiaceae bacterium]|nr:hypothetical protein [Streptosporangiaceae bacterium]
MSVTAPKRGQLVRVRGGHWVVTNDPEPTHTTGDGQVATDTVDGQTLIELMSVSDGGYGDELQVIWVRRDKPAWRRR